MLFRSGEQNDYALRAKKMGFNLVYTHKAKIWHYHHLSSADGEEGYPSIAYWKAYSGMLLSYLHTKKTSFFSFYMYRVSKELIKAIKGLIVDRHSFRTPNLLAYYYFTRSIVFKESNTHINPFL